MTEDLGSLETAEQIAGGIFDEIGNRQETKLAAEKLRGIWGDKDWTAPKIVEIVRENSGGVGDEDR